MREAQYYDKQGGHTVCRLCPHHCRIAPGQRGLCRLRTNDSGTLYAQGYGKIASLALDPIEKKPLNRFYPGRTILTVGGYGCNLCCQFCQNHEISQQAGEGRFYAPEELTKLAAEQRRYGNIGLAFSYNEPLISFEYVKDTAALLRKAGLKTVLVSNGYVEEAPLKELLPLIDAMNIDIKAFRDETYRRICGGTLEPVLRTVRLAARQCHLEVTTLVIPGVNDSEEEIAAIAGFIADISPEIPLHLSRFFPRYRMADREPPSRQKMAALGEAAAGRLRHIYWGNM